MAVSVSSARVYFFLIVFQIPFFRVPCRAGMCTTPIHLISSVKFSSPLVKALLYPRPVVNGLIKKNMTVPSWNDLLDNYNLTTTVKDASPVIDLQRLEVLAGSYICVVGAVVGLFVPGRMTMYGTLLIIWGLVKEGILGKPANTDPTKAIYIYPTIALALICTLYDVMKAMIMNTAPAPAQPIAKPVRRTLKSS